MAWWYPCIAVALLVGALAGVTPAATWRWAHPRPAGVLTTRVLCIGQRFLAFGPTQLLESPDGRDWTDLGGDIFPPVTAVGTFPPVTDALVFRGGIVAITDDAVASSVDGMSWTVHIDFGWDRPCTTFGGVATDGLTVVAVGFDCQETMGAYEKPMAYFSSNGSDWSAAVLPALDPDGVDREELSDVTWDGRRFVAAGYSDCQPLLYTSPDGRQWSRTLGAGGSVAASGGGTTLVASGSRVWTSTDGERWNESTLPDGAGWIDGLEWVRDRFVAASPRGVLTSPDGAAWSFRPLAVDARLTEVATDGTGVVLGGRDFYFSDDFEQWTPWQIQRLTTARLDDVAVGMWRAVVVGGGGTVMTSTDGDSWTLAASGGTGLTRVVFGGGRWLALGFKRALWSDDGVLWHAEPGLPDEGANDLAWGAGEFVAVDSNGAYVSADGVVWVRGDLPAGYSAETVSWTGSEFVASGWIYAGGFGYALFRSRDGRTWRSAPAPEAPCRPSRVVGVAGREFVVCRGCLYSSQDGEGWTLVPANSYLLDLDAVGGRLLATSQGDVWPDRQLLLSRDGVNWEPVGPPPAGALAFAALGARLIAVGDDGSIRYFGDAHTRTVRRRLGSSAR